MNLADMTVSLSTSANDSEVSRVRASDLVSGEADPGRTGDAILSPVCYAIALSTSSARRCVTDAVVTTAQGARSRGTALEIRARRGEDGRYKAATREVAGETFVQTVPALRETERCEEESSPAATGRTAHGQRIRLNPWPILDRFHARVKNTAGAHVSRCREAGHPGRRALSGGLLFRSAHSRPESRTSS